MTNEFLWQIAIAIGSAGAMYGAIRADLRALHERVKNAQDTGNKAHERIDTMLNNGAKR